MGYLAQPNLLTEGGIDAGEETATAEPAAWTEGDFVGQRGWVELVHRNKGRRARWNQDCEKCFAMEWGNCWINMPAGIGPYPNMRWRGRGPYPFKRGAGGNGVASGKYGREYEYTDWTLDEASVEP